LKIDQDNLPIYGIFRVLNVAFAALQVSIDLIGLRSRKYVHVSVKEGYPRNFRKLLFHRYWLV